MEATTPCAAGLVEGVWRWTEVEGVFRGVRACGGLAAAAGVVAVMVLWFRQSPLQVGSGTLAGRSREFLSKKGGIAQLRLYPRPPTNFGDEETAASACCVLWR